MIKNKKGFTLIEILTVVMIIGILTAVALPQYNKAVEKAKITEAQVMLKSLYDSSERLAAEFGYTDYLSMAGDWAMSSKNIGVIRLDMFGTGEDGNSVLPTGYSYSNNGQSPTDVLVSPQFSFKLLLGPGNRYLGAKTNTDPYLNTLILFDRETQDLFCQEASGSSDACDVFNLPTVTGVTF